jgi:mRNA-degrading endonuclease RelE of RelBE toxin-antitoxin system
VALRLRPGAGSGETAARIRHAASVDSVELAQARNVKVPTNHRDGYRLRVADCRVFFDFGGVVRIVGIEEVRKRDGGTY